MPPPMIRVTRFCAPERAGGGRAGLGDGVAANPGRSCDASRRITRTSSSTERPFRAARSRSSALMASSSLRMVRLAIRGTTAGSDSTIMLALLSDCKPAYCKQDADKGDGDDPQRDGAPAVLAAFGA